MKIPQSVPKPGFYYHYKHNPAGPINNYAYEVLGIGIHTEDADQFLVVYRPLYEEVPFYETEKLFYVRPLNMFSENVAVNGALTPRFTQITDTETIRHLGEIRDRMYK